MREAKRRGEVPKLDGDPFLDAQEWEIENLAIIGRRPTDRRRPARSPSTISASPPRIALDLVQTQAGWRIADIKGPSGSLSALYKQS